ncbi:phospholipase [Stenotrophomonas humi]|uniref:Phospholipase n=1 Tax=Stenotrophomonas humi TaxID=405444 RepID=A0A0R0C278_9GAMM|nr:alpha/beta hydrolase-fold protein [Stenotrophomonas humi]KRG63430.1 phospholipase [Stenotrophomonas humi]
MRRTLMLLFLSVLAGCASSSTVTGDPGGYFVARELAIEGRQFRYRVFVPAAHVPRPLPVLLFLHGSGERGDDGIKPTQAGVGPWITQHKDSFPALVVFPQVPDDEEWRGRNARMALAALDAANAEFATDPARNYISGISMGGYGTWELALTRPTQFAAVMPICGALLAPRAERPGLVVDQVAGSADPYETVASRLHGVPVWMFHGALDALVPPRDDRAIAEASQKRQAGFRYTEYPDTQHNAWDPTYRNPAVWEWMFSQRRQ